MTRRTSPLRLFVSSPQKRMPISLPNDTSNHVASAVDTQNLPCHPARQIRDKEQDAIRDILRRPKALERQPFNQAMLVCFAHRVPLALSRRVRAHEAGGD